MALINNGIMVSVYCLAYNHEKYIRDTLNGFVSQVTNFKYEVFVHDDASTDKTASIIREYANKYPDIIKPIFQTENQYSKGVRIFRTYIYPRISGKYVAVCEGDDYWCCTNKLQKQVDILEADKSLSACVHQTTQIDCIDGTLNNICKYTQNCIARFDDIIQRGNNVFQISSLMYRKAYLDNLPSFCTSMKNVGDYPMAIYLALVGNIYYINENMSVYRLFSSAESWTSINSISRNKTRWIENCEDAISMLNQADEYSEYKYHEQFMAVINRHEFDIEKLTKGKWIIFQQKYKGIRNEKHGLHYIKWIVGYLLPESIVYQLKKIRALLKTNFKYGR